MSPSREFFLSLNDVEEMILCLEHKYAISSAEFFGNSELRARVPEDDVFRWEALIDHRRALKEAYEEVHRGYLTTLDHSAEKQQISADEPLLAA